MPKTPLITAGALFVLAACAPAESSLFTDTTAPASLRAEVESNPTGDVAQVQRVWLQYIVSKNGFFDCSPSPYWIESEQVPIPTPDGRVIPPCYDLAGSTIPPEHKFAVMSIEPVRGSDNKEYRIITRFRPQNPNIAAALVTVYAVRSDTTWKLAGAMGMETRSWRHEKVGPFTYVISPGYNFSRTRAEEAVAFADSVARAFGVPPIAPLKYYLVEDGDAMMRLQGVQLDTTYGTPGGRSLPGFIISGDRAFGENHGHEIAHRMIFPLQGPRLSVAGSEGVPSWLGGTRSMRFADQQRALRKYLAQHPATTLDSLLARNDHVLHNSAAALLASMVHERSGVDGIRRFLNSGPSLSEFRTGVAEIFSAPWDSVAADWKRRVRDESLLTRHP